jgi:predicted nucleotide-binding protein
MTVDEAKALLARAGLEVQKQQRLGNETGTQLRLSNGSIVNVFDKGTVNVQGKNRPDTEAILGIGAAGIVDGAAVAGPKRNVFVVYGHDQHCRDQLEAMLRRWSLEPLILDQLPTEGQTVIEKLESALAEADFGVVLATPDDEGNRAGHA